MPLLVGVYVMALRSSNSFNFLNFYFIKKIFFPPTLFRRFRVRGVLQSSVSPCSPWNVRWSLLATILGSGEMYLLSTCARRIPSRDLWAGDARSIKCPASWAHSHKIHLPCTHFPAHISLHFQMLFSFLLSPELKAAAWLSSHTQMHLLKTLFWPLLSVVFII